MKAAELTGATAPPSIYPGKKHGRFVVLDGVRGVAAIIVMLGHLMTNSGWNVGFPFGWTAVDLFFILSGFVVAFAYQAKIDAGMGFVAFVRLRLIRLYPLYAIGCAMGVISIFAWGPLYRPLGINVAAASALGFSFLPYFSRRLMPFDLRGARTPIEIFPLNPPSWSLLDEILINILFGYLAVRRLRISILFYVALVAVVAFKVIGKSTGAFGILNGGWGDDNAWEGIIRVAYGFPLGVILYRLYRKQSRFGFSLNGWLVILVVVLAMAVPSNFGGSLQALRHLEPNYPYFLSMIVWPGVVWAGAHATLGPGAAKFFGWLGGISYAVYAIHFPLFRICCRFGSSSSVATIGCAAAISVACADVLTRYADPYLRGLLTKRSARSSAA